MSEALYAALARMPDRQLRLLAAGVVAIGLMATWTLAVRAPWLALRAAQTRLAAAPAVPAAAVAAVPAEEARRLAELERSARARRAAPDTVLGLIDAVNRSARRFGVDVNAATPMPPRDVAGLRELPLDVQASGSYAALQAWLADIGTALPTAAVGSIDLQPGDAPERREAKIQVALYVQAVRP